MFIINRCFKNIWLESQMIHVALFSFQRTTLSFEARFRLKGFASSDSFIVPHLFQTVKNFFIFLFIWVIYSSKALPIKERYSRLSRCLAATCIILQELRPFVNSFSEKNHKKSRTTVEPHGSTVNAGSRHPFYLIWHVGPTASYLQDGCKAHVDGPSV